MFFGSRTKRSDSFKANAPETVGIRALFLLRHSSLHDFYSYFRASGKTYRFLRSNIHFLSTPQLRSIHPQSHLEGKNGNRNHESGSDQSRPLSKVQNVTAKAMLALGLVWQIPFWLDDIMDGTSQFPIDAIWRRPREINGSPIFAHEHSRFHKIRALTSRQTYERATRNEGGVRGDDTITFYYPLLVRPKWGKPVRTLRNLNSSGWYILTFFF